MGRIRLLVTVVNGTMEHFVRTRWASVETAPVHLAPAKIGLDLTFAPVNPVIPVQTVTLISMNA